VATQILALPLLSFGMTVGTNEDWLDSWVYVDTSSNPISLAGLVLNMMVRPTPDDAYAVVVASTAASVAGLSVNGTIVAGGIGGNVIALRIPYATMLRVAPGAYVFEVQAQGDGETRTIAAGAVTVIQGVVR
jgi:hypothetical protein